MKTRERLDIILHTACTTDALEHQLQLWRECMEYALYHTTTTDVVEAAAGYGGSLAATTDREIVSSWPTAIWSGVQADNFTAVYEGMVTDSAALAVLVVYVPVSLPEEEIAELSMWCRTECGVDMLELKIDPAVVGGVGFIDAHDRYQEISWRSKLALAPDAITQVIARYA